MPKYYYCLSLTSLLKIVKLYLVPLIWASYGSWIAFSIYCILKLHYSTYKIYSASQYWVPSDIFELWSFVCQSFPSPKIYHSTVHCSYYIIINYINQSYLYICNMILSLCRSVILTIYIIMMITTGSHINQKMSSLSNNSSILSLCCVYDSVLALSSSTTGDHVICNNMMNITYIICIYSSQHTIHTHSHSHVGNTYIHDVKWLMLSVWYVNDNTYTTT